MPDYSGLKEVIEKVDSHLSLAANAVKNGHPDQASYHQTSALTTAIIGVAREIADLRDEIARKR